MFKDPVIHSIEFPIPGVETMDVHITPLKWVWKWFVAYAESFCLDGVDELTRELDSSVKAVFTNIEDCFLFPLMSIHKSNEQLSIVTSFI